MRHIGISANRPDAESVQARSSHLVERKTQNAILKSENQRVDLKNDSRNPSDSSEFVKNPPLQSVARQRTRQM
jgi:hypothetical protein